MPGNSLSELEIINQARQLAGLNTLDSAKQFDDVIYDQERTALLTQGAYAFAQKHVLTDTLGIQDNGFFELPRDFLSIFCPSFDVRTGNQARLAYGNEMIYIANIKETSKYDPVFVTALIYGITFSYSEWKRDTERMQLYKQRQQEMVNHYLRSEAFNKPTLNANRGTSGFGYYGGY